jgi:hypothetical protein
MAEQKFSLQAKLTAETAQFQAAIGKANETMGKFTTTVQGGGLTGRAAKDGSIGGINPQSLTSGVNQAMGAVNSLSGGMESLGAATGMASQAMGVATQAAEAFKNPAAAAGAITAGIGLLITGMVTAINTASKWATEVATIKRMTGMAAEESSRWAYAMKLTGIDTTTSTRLLVQLTKATELHADKLRAAGVEIARNADGSTDLTGTLLNLSDAYKDSTNTAGKNAEVIKILGLRGSQATDALRLLGKGSEELNRTLAQTPEGLLLNDKNLKDAADFKQSMRELNIEFQAIFVTVGKELIPVIRDLTKIAIDVMPAITATVKGTVAAFEGLVAQVKPFVNTWGAMASFIPGMDGMAESMKNFGNQTDSAGKALADMTNGAANVDMLGDSIDSAADKMGRLAGAVSSYFSAQRSEAQAIKGVTDAKAKLAEAEAEAAELRAKGAVDLTKMQAGMEALERATEGVTRAQERAGDVQKRINELSQQRNDLDLQEARLRQQEAATSIQDANLRLAEARNALANTYNPLDRARAEMEVVKAQDAVAKAGVDRQKADADLVRIHVEGTKWEREMAAAQRDLREATASVEDAVKRRADAQAKLREAQAGDPDFDKKLAAADKLVADAKFGVADATMAWFEAEMRLYDEREKFQTAVEENTDAMEPYLARVREITSAHAELNGVAQQWLGATLGTAVPAGSLLGTSISGGGGRIATTGTAGLLGWGVPTVNVTVNGGYGSLADLSNAVRQGVAAGVSQGR